MDLKRPADHEATWLLMIGGLLAVVALVVVIVSDLPRSERTPPARNSMVSAPPFADPPLPVLPSVSPSPPASRAPRAHRPSTVPVRTSSPPMSRTPPPPPPAPPVWAAAGSVVVLSPADQPRRGVRHRDFRVWVGRGAGASFRVQPGLAAATCLSLESVDAPGHYLRHQNFTVFLHPRDRSALFAADATFCPVLDADGSAVLRSVNYPDRHLVVDDSRVYLRAAPGTAFVARTRL